MAKNSQRHHAELKNNGYREGNFPLPKGTVVTLRMDKVDRGHTDSLRLPGTTVFISIYRSSIDECSNLLIQNN
jgi:hypothetical protein